MYIWQSNDLRAPPAGNKRKCTEQYLPRTRADVAAQSFGGTVLVPVSVLLSGDVLPVATRERITARSQSHALWPLFGRDRPRYIQVSEWLNYVLIRVAMPRLADSLALFRQANHLATSKMENHLAMSSNISINKPFSSIQIHKLLNSVEIIE